MKKYFAILLFSIIFVACTSVDSGHKGVEVSWGGKTNMNKIYDEGLHSGLHWIIDDMVEYDVREKTLTKKFEFNDKNNMKTGVELSVDYSLQGNAVNSIHSKIGKDQIEYKILTTISSAAKQVIPQYSATELNLNKREEAEDKFLEIVKKEFPDFYVNASRVRITDVDIPDQIAEAAEANAKQQELNKLSQSKVEQAKNEFSAAEYNAKTKAILSKPEMLELQRVENERLMWEGFKKHGKSPYGEHNVFGGNLLLSKLLNN